MIDHKVTIRDRAVSTDFREIVQDSNEADRIILSLDSDWDGLDEIYVVLGKGYDKLVTPYDPEDPPTFPAELTEKLGPLAFSVVGTKGERVQITRRADSLFRIVPRGDTIE